jgi:predicted HAD superfamily Cof-like phosphohydrolase
MRELNETLRWFELAVPAPTDKNKSTQIGCWIEESCEVLEALGDDIYLDAMTDLAEAYKSYDGVITLTTQQRIDLLDGLCDTIVTAVGVAHMFDMDIIAAMNEVNRSNFSKFVDGKPVFNEQGKIAKPSTYSKPELEKFV